MAIVSFILISVGGGSYYKKTSPNSNWNKPHKNVPQNPFCRFTRNSSCSGISPQRCLAHIIAKSYHFRTVIQLSRCTRENIPQGVTFKTPIFVGFFKTFLFSLKSHNKKSRHIDSTNSGRIFLPLAQFVLKLCNGLNFKL